MPIFLYFCLPKFSFLAANFTQYLFISFILFSFFFLNNDLVNIIHEAGGGSVERSGSTSGGGGSGGSNGGAGDARGGGNSAGRRRRAARKESRLRESRSLNRIAEVRFKFSFIYGFVTSCR